MSIQEQQFLSPFSQPEIFEFGNPIVEGVKYFVSRIVSCWHVRLSRPFTHGKESYRVCLRCGMQREFDLQTWKSVGRFYPSPIGRRSR